MNKNTLKFSVDFERLWKLGPNFLQSKDGQDALVSGSLNSVERLFISLASSPLLNTTSLQQGKKIIESGELFDEAYFVLSGEIQILQKDKSYKLGAGSVIGLSEGMVGLASKFSATSLTSVQVKIIPFHRVDAVIEVLPDELRVILLTIIKRNLAAKISKSYQLNQFTVEKFRDEEFICKSGDPATHLYFLHEGEVELVSASGQVFGMIPQGQSFGEAAILKGGIRNASIRAKGDVVCKVIASDQAAEMLTSFSPLLVVIMEALLLQQAMNNSIKNS